MEPTKARRTRHSLDRFYSGGPRPPARDQASGAGEIEEDGELAALQARLIETMRRQPDDFRLLLHGTETLSRSLTAEQRSSTKATKQLAANFEAVLKSVGDQILPP